MARIPHMVLVTTGQRAGVDAAAAAWAAQRGVICIAFGLYGRGNGKAFKRNRNIAELMPVEALLCEGSGIRSEEHTSELQSLMRISYAVFCLKKKKKQKQP